MGSVGQYTQGWMPWMAVKAQTTFSTLANRATVPGCATRQSNGTQNDEFTVDVWLDIGTWKYAQNHWKDITQGIYSIQLDGVEQGTIDGYNASTVDNVYSEITGIVVSVAGLKTFKMKMATKNASATNYYGVPSSCAWIRTSGTGSTPSGTDTPGYTWHYLPWMGSKANTGWATSTQNQSHLGGALLSQASPAQNNAVSWDIWLDTGTYKYAQIHYVSTDRGIYSVQLNAVEKGTIDGYSAGTTANTYSEVTGITVSVAAATTFQLKMANKNASSSGYNSLVNSCAWIRTGA